MCTLDFERKLHVYILEGEKVILIAYCFDMANVAIGLIQSVTLINVEKFLYLSLNNNQKKVYVYKQMYPSNFFFTKK